MVGSHNAGTEVYKPLIDESVGKLLARHAQGVQPASYNPNGPQPLRICFVGVENKSIEEMGDFKEQIYQAIDTRITQSGTFQTVSRRFVDAGLQQARLRPDMLFIPQNMRNFSAPPWSGRASLSTTCSTPRSPPAPPTTIATISAIIC